MKIVTWLRVEIKFEITLHRLFVIQCILNNKSRLMPVQWNNTNSNRSRSKISKWNRNYGFGRSLNGHQQQNTAVIQTNERYQQFENPYNFKMHKSIEAFTLNQSIWPPLQTINSIPLSIRRWWRRQRWWWWRRWW